MPLAFLSPVPLSLPQCSSPKRQRRPQLRATVPIKTVTKDLRPPRMRKCDAVVIGSGIGALTAAASLVAQGAQVIVLERYLIPGGSSGQFRREGFTFDVGASMIFGFGKQGTTNLLTKALALVDKELPTFPDPVQVRYHLPGVNIRVHREYEKFIAELVEKFPEEENGIRAFYGECWSVFNSLNEMPLKSLEEPAYLLKTFFNHPKACLNLLGFLAVNAGDIARKHIKNELLLKFIDMECYSWSVASADMTPMINAGMVFSDRHYGGVNYPRGGVGRISEELALGITEREGCTVDYASRVTKILLEDGVAKGVELADGSHVMADVVISNATRWDTFGGLLQEKDVPESERKFRERYVKSPSFCSVHMAVRESKLEVSMREDRGMDCHHIMLDNWDEMETARDAKGTLFVSIPSILDHTLGPPGFQVFHVFTPSWLDEWTGLSPKQYKAKKKAMLDTMVSRLERHLFPGLSDAIEFVEVGSPRTHRRFLGRTDGSYGPVPRRKLRGLLSMPFNRTDVKGLYCVGDSTFPGQGLNATAFSGFACGHRVAADLGLVPRLPDPVDTLLSDLLSRRRLQL